MSVVYWDGKSLIADRCRVSPNGNISSMTKLGMVTGEAVAKHLEEQERKDALQGYKVLYGYCGDHSKQAVAKAVAEMYIIRAASDSRDNRDYARAVEEKTRTEIVAVLLKDNVPIETLFFDDSMFAISNAPVTPLAIGSSCKEALYCYHAGYRDTEIMRYVRKADSVISGVTKASPENGYVPMHVAE